MERRVLPPLIFSFLVVYGYQALFPTPPDPALSRKPVQASKAATAPNASAPARSNPAPSIQPPNAPLPAESGAPSQPARDVELDNADVHAVFTSRGGVL